MDKQRWVKKVKWSSGKLAPALRAPVTEVDAADAALLAEECGSFTLSEPFPCLILLLQLTLEVRVNNAFVESIFYNRQDV